MLHKLLFFLYEVIPKTIQHFLLKLKESNNYYFKTFVNKLKYKT